MENASKALLIAASILIGILLVNMWIFLANNFKGVSDSYYDRFSTEEKQKYNSEILRNITSENKITAQGIVTIININNEKELNMTMDLSEFDSLYDTIDEIKENQSEFLQSQSR